LIYARTHATILAAQLRGPFLDLDATGDTRRIADAYQHFVWLLGVDTPSSAIHGQQPPKRRLDDAPSMNPSAIGS
jgi:hypothetical protein